MKQPRDAKVDGQIQFTKLSEQSAARESQIVDISVHQVILWIISTPETHAPHPLGEHRALMRCRSLHGNTRTVSVCMDKERMV
jgi:hypothetical protein